MKCVDFFPFAKSEGAWSKRKKQIKNGLGNISQHFGKGLYNKE